MKRLASIVVLGFALITGPGLATADAPEHVINHAGQTSTVDCGDGGKVVVNGSTNTVTITGGCAKVVVNGATNTVAIAAADKIAVNGTGNTVTWSKGWKKKAPKVSRLGVGNKVIRIK